ncbi:uncharacterized protein LOC129582040 [Paramacrobiotus metropolitanus]|uniref:uncharacterized protein LOC129582040 n=1 Tax=Paramacrobiotus metropolitanus TaxID=2943436 RepID=UPI002445DEAD|nr:uncharacterized protein LOC129582040 [Paramacrobiotus metropolitanus]XP_055329389.1 uncharacterized protein LOC129582040 [Paramacrobiotus metropolitanus]XP_055329390.1 uncharacterized protein LOC129582040 [Paramacrobiotus metropolitanus]
MWTRRPAFWRPLPLAIWERFSSRIFLAWPLKDACSNPSTNQYWQRSDGNYQFDLMDTGFDADNEVGGIIALSRCSTRTLWAAPGSGAAVAVLRRPFIMRSSYAVFRVTFWFRLSDYPTIGSSEREDFVLKVFVRGTNEWSPDAAIWGTADDYSGVQPDQWHFGQAVFSRDSYKEFSVNILANHNDYCQANVKTIALDAIQTQEEVSAPN